MYDYGDAHGFKNKWRMKTGLEVHASEPPILFSPLLTILCHVACLHLGPVYRMLVHYNPAFLTLMRIRQRHSHLLWFKDIVRHLNCFFYLI